MEPEVKVSEEFEIHINYLQIFNAIRSGFFVIILTALLGIIAAFFVSTQVIHPKYESTTRIYVLNKQEENMQAISYSDLQIASQLTLDYMAMVTTRPTLETVISRLGLDTDYETLLAQISVSTVTDTRLIAITVTDENPGQAREIANAVRESVADQILRVMDVEAVNVVEEANMPVKKANMRTWKVMVIGGGIGFVLALIVIVLRAILDDKIRTPDDMERLLGISTLGTIPLDHTIKKASKKKEKKKARK